MSESSLTSADGSEASQPEATLWKIMDFTKYVSMLHHGALFFSRADQLPDPFEGARTRHSTLGVGRTARDEHLRKRVLLNCWHQNEHESAAMWRIYSGWEDGVAVRSSLRRLRDSLSAVRDTVRLGMVRYVDYQNDDVRQHDELSPFFCKRKHFEFEREVRAVWVPEPPPADEELGRYLEVNLGTLIESVVTTPTAEPWFGELVASVSERYGCRFAVETSSMLDEPEPDAVAS